VAKVVENAQVDIPDVMIERQIDSMVRDYNMRLNYQGLDLDKYLMIMGIDYQTFRISLETGRMMTSRGSWFWKGSQSGGYQGIRRRD